MTRTIALSALALVAASPVAAEPTHWTFDSTHSVAAFSVRHLVVSTVRGDLGKVTGTVTLDRDDPSKSSVTASIDVTGITTREEKRDAHLRSPDFFDVKAFPTVTFQSTKVEKAGEGKLKITGDLTMHGVTKRIDFIAEGPASEVSAFGKTKTGFSATTKLNRKDYGVSWGKTLDNGGAVVGDEVTVQLDLELDKVVVAKADASGPEAAKAAKN